MMTTILKDGRGECQVIFELIGLVCDVLGRRRTFLWY